MANTIITSQILTREFLEVLHSNTPIIKNLDRSFEKYFGPKVDGNLKTGPTLNIRKPNRFSRRSTWVMDQQDLTEPYQALTIDTVSGTDLNFSDADLATSVGDFRKRYIDPAGKGMAADLDKQMAEYMLKWTPNEAHGTLGTAPADLTAYLSGGQKIKENLVPLNSPLNAVIHARSEATLVKGLSGQYNPNGNISSMYEKGQMAMAGGFDFYMSQVLPSLTTGTRTNTTNTVASFSTANSTITLSSATSGGTVVAGDTFTVDTAYAVNPETGQTYADLQQFVCTAATTGVGTDITIPVHPAVVTSGAYKNVSATPTGGQAAYVGATASTTYPVDLCFHKDSYAFASVPLIIPGGMSMANSASYENLNIRFVRGYDIVNARMLSRMDIFFGMTYLRPEWACKILG